MILSEEQNINNITNFKRILPSFFYDSRTKESVLRNCVISSGKDETYFYYIDKLFNLSNYRRDIIYESSGRNISEIASSCGFRLYITIIDHIYNISPSSSDIYSIINRNWGNLCSVQSYAANSVTLYNEESPRKLFRYLLNKKIITEDQLAKLNSLKLKKSKNTSKYILSRNPVDMLLAATGQSFTSCASLYSTHGGAYYMAMAALTADPNRVIIYNTTEEPTYIEIKKKKFYYRKYNSRAFAYLMKGCDKETYLVIDRIFPVLSHWSGSLDNLKNSILKKHKSLKDIIFIEQLRMDDRIVKKYNSFFKFYTPKYVNNRIALPYFDYTMYNIDKNEKMEVTTYKGSTMCPTEFSTCISFDNIDYIEQLYPPKYNCSLCNVPIYFDYKIGYLRSEDLNFDIIYNCLCKQCFLEKIFECSNCGRMFSKENGFFNKTINSGKHKLCYECNKSFIVCDICKTTFLGSPTYDFEKSSNDKIYTICPNCIGDKVMCYSCLKLISKNSSKTIDSTYIYICEECYDG